MDSSINLALGELKVVPNGCQNDTQCSRSGDSNFHGAKDASNGSESETNGLGCGRKVLPVSVRSKITTTVTADDQLTTNESPTASGYRQECSAHEGISRF